MPIALGFTGTQQGMTAQQKDRFAYVLGLLYPLEGSEFHHGDCVGADKQSHDLVRLLTPMLIHIHPPALQGKRAFCKGDTFYSPKSYLDRDRDIVKATEALIATPRGMEEELRSGTWATIRYARKLDRPIYLILPDGSLVDG